MRKRSLHLVSGGLGMERMFLASIFLIGAICLISGAPAKNKKPTQTCRQYVYKMGIKMQREPHRVPQDMELPKCDRNGNYKLKQCYGSWRGGGNCGCYKRVTGQRIRRVTGVSSRSPEAAMMTCQCAYDQIFTWYNFDCNRETGDYKPVRCVGSRCFCAERTGEPIRGYRSFNNGASNCLCAREQHDSRSRGVIGRSWNCENDGRYASLQYHGSMVYCVNEYGQKTGRAYHVSSREAQKLRCRKK